MTQHVEIPTPLLRWRAVFQADPLALEMGRCYNGQPFEVMHLDVQTRMWMVRFACGCVRAAYLDEIAEPVEVG